MVLALWSSEALELGKWAVLGQIDGNHTSSQFALPHGGRERKGRREGERKMLWVGGGGGGSRGMGGVREGGGVCRSPLGTEKRLNS